MIALFANQKKYFLNLSNLHYLISTYLQYLQSLSFKTIMFLVVLLVPVLGTCLSLVLADKATLIVFKSVSGRALLHY